MAARFFAVRRETAGGHGEIALFQHFAEFFLAQNGDAQSLRLGEL